MNAKALEQRILSTFPAGHYALEAFFSLVDVRLTDSVDTAAVECRATPALLINPAFVLERCRTDEHLFILVLHEVHHVLLGHTRFFPRITPAQNLAFDAVINALLSRQFPTEPYISFFKNLYRADTFPECLLRPPEGWPHKVRWPKKLSERTKSLLNTIYSEVGATYTEIFEALSKELGSSKLPEGILLLGDHGSEEGLPGRGLEAVRAVALREAIRTVVERWPQPPNPIMGRSVGSEIRESLIKKEPVVPEAQKVLRRAVAALTQTDPRAVHRSGQTGLGSFCILSPLPSPSDRSALVRLALGGEPLLYRSEISHRRGASDPSITEIFLDVSGSVANYLPHLLSAVSPFTSTGRARVWGFSDQVVALSVKDIAKRSVRTTGGTNIAAVTEFILAKKIRRALILTDGYVGRITPRHKKDLKKCGVRIWVGLTSNGFRNDLEPLVEKVFDLPGI